MAKARTEMKDLTCAVTVAVGEGRRDGGERVGVSSVGVELRPKAEGARPR